MTTTGDVRSRFPGLSDGWVRLDGPAGTLPVDTCVDAIADYMRSPAPANLGGEFDASKESVAVVDRAREAVAGLIGAEADEIVFGPSTTNLMFAFTRALAQHWGPGDRIVCTQLDHDSNVSPWLLAARDSGATVEMLEVDPVDGTLDVEPLKGLCADGRTRWVAISGASNLTGHAPDLERAVAIAHEHGARILVDGVARVPHLPTDAAALGVDVLSTSPYKWYGPHAGVLAVRNGLLGEIEPYRVRPADYVGPLRWETGTTQIELLAGITAAAEFMTSTSIADEAARETRLLALLQEGLHELPGRHRPRPVGLAGPGAHRRLHGPRPLTGGGRPLPREPAHRGVARRQLRLRARRRPRAARVRRPRARRRRALHDRGRRRRAARGAGRAWPGVAGITGRRGAPAGVRRRERVRRTRTTEVPALAVVDAETAQVVGVLGGLDALGDDARAGAVPRTRRASRRGWTSTGSVLTPSTMVRSSLMTSGRVRTMWRSEEKPAPTSSIARRMPPARSGSRARQERVVVLDRVVLGELEQDAVERVAHASSARQSSRSSVSGETFIAT